MNARSNVRFVALASAVALGVMAGVALARSKRLAFRARSRLQGDWLGHLKAEHRVMRRLLKSMTHADFEHAPRRAALLEKVGELLTRHAVEEENVVYPALAAIGADGALLDDHAEMKTLVRDLQALPLEDARWIEQARALRKLFHRHMREEEEEIFPLLRERLGEAENEKMTKLVTREGVRVG
jgi:hemerythrin superfamily protein